MVIPIHVEFAFFVDKSGKRAKKEFIVYWEGKPVSFGFHSPYIVAFDQDFIEVRHIETGNLEQIIRGQHIQCLDGHNNQLLIKSQEQVYILNIK